MIHIFLIDIIFASFRTVNMFPSIDNRSGMEAVYSVLLKRSTKIPHNECSLEGLELCLTCSNSIFSH